ncbi:hypothetical protein ABF87_14555 [Nitrosomonas sp. JL21]|uniref:hypothetical protein n=1 Tax=Nitrosomonas sp. JL21 TaxID=153949 RepID=UPI0013699340|nr:hypothetical protein [Nitrosomonas sp. JL21]MXS79155.1 hypothetical protein [Nitrosomonas sp. JL21]
METNIIPWRIFPKTIDASCYNRGRLVVLRLGNPFRITLQQHCGLDVILSKDIWLCVDSNLDDQPILAWRKFQTSSRLNLHLPISCELWLYHSCAGLIMGSALDDLDQALGKFLY